MAAAVSTCQTSSSVLSLHQGTRNESEVPHGRNRQQFLERLLCARHCVGKDHSSAQEAEVPVLKS